MLSRLSSWHEVEKLGIGGEAGIRTLGTGLSPYNGLANRRLQPLGHLTVMRTLSIREASSCGNPAVPRIVPEIVPAGPRAPARIVARRADDASKENAAVFSAK